MKKVIIIGAGVTGLVAAVYAARSGFDVTVYEAHCIPGGASSSWKRKGYHFEGGMHWLAGSSRDKMLHKIWEETGALNDSVKLHLRDPYLTLDHNGQTISLYRNSEKLKEHLLSISPEDNKEITKLCRDIMAYANLDMPVTDIKGVKTTKKSKMGIKRAFKMLPVLRTLKYYQNQSCLEYSKRYKSELIQRLLTSTVSGHNNALSLLYTLGVFASNDGAYPEGGSMAMAKRMEEKAKSYGVKFIYNSKVDRVIVENGSAKGIRIGDDIIYSDAVIVTQDPMVAYKTLFETPLPEKYWAEMENVIIPSSCTYYCFGVKEDLSDYFEKVVYTIPGFEFAGTRTTELGLTNHARMEGYAPKGCSSLTGSFTSHTYDWWKEKKENGTYYKEKEKLANTLLEVLYQRVPRIIGKVEVWDIATPLTYEKYLHSYKGSWMSILREGHSIKYYPITVESVKNLYFAGHRMMLPGGLPICAETGRRAVQFLCKENKQTFMIK